MLRSTILVLACTLVSCGQASQPAPEYQANPATPPEAATPAPEKPAPAVETQWEGGLPPHLLQEPNRHSGLAELAIDSRLQDQGKLVLDVTTITTFTSDGDPQSRRVETPQGTVTSRWEFTYERPHLPATVVFESKGKTTTRKVRHEFDDNQNLLRSVAEIDGGKTVIETFARKRDGTYTATRESVDAGQTQRIGHDLFDSQGNRRRKCIEGTGCTSYRYDGHGNLLGERSEQDGSEPIDYAVTVDASGRETSRKEPNKNLVRTTEYDGEGRILRQERMRIPAKGGEGLLYEQLSYRYTPQAPTSETPEANTPPTPAGK